MRLFSQSSTTLSSLSVFWWGRENNVWYGSMQRASRTRTDVFSHLLAVLVVCLVVEMGICVPWSAI
jgi:hypothetical protein